VKFGKLLIVAMMVGVLLSLGAPDVQADKTFKIGVIMPLSGQLSVDGANEANGAKMAAEDINAQGGIKVGGENYKVELIVYDDQAIPKESAAAMEKLATRDGVKMVIGPFTSSACLASMPIAAREKIVMSSPNASSEKLTEVGNKWFFRGGMTIKNGMSTQISFIKKLGMNPISYIAANDEWGRNSVAQFKEWHDKNNTKVISVDYFDHGTTDFYSVLTNIKGKNPKGILAMMETKVFAVFLRQAKEICPEIKIIDTAGVMPFVFVKLVPPSISEGVYCYTLGPPLDDKSVVHLVKRFRDKYSADPSSYFFSGYDVMMMFADAVKRAGTVDDRDKIREAMTKTDYHGIMGRYNFDAKNNNSLSLWGVGQYRGGKVHVWKYK